MSKSNGPETMSTGEIFSTFWTRNTEVPSSVQGWISPLKIGSKAGVAGQIIYVLLTKYYKLFQAPRFDLFLSGMIHP